MQVWKKRRHHPCRRQPIYQTGLICLLWLPSLPKNFWSSWIRSPHSPAQKQLILFWENPNQPFLGDLCAGPKPLTDLPVNGAPTWIDESHFLVTSGERNSELYLVSDSGVPLLLGEAVRDFIYDFIEGPHPSFAEAQQVLTSYFQALKEGCFAIASR